MSLKRVRIQAEFVLKRRKSAAVEVPAKRAPAKKAPVKRAKKAKEPKESVLLQQLAEMTAQMKLMKKEKKKSSKVNVYVNQPEPKQGLSDKARRDLMEI